MLALAATKDRQKSRDISVQVGASLATIKTNNANPGRPTYGYTSVGEVKFQKTLVQVPAEAAVIREAVERYLAGETIDAICADFNRRHIPSPTWKGKPGKHWHAKTLAGLLRSESTAGRRMGNKPVLDAAGKPVKDPITDKPVTTRVTLCTFPGIITWDEHERLVARLDSRAYRKGISPVMQRC